MDNNTKPTDPVATAELPYTAVTGDMALTFMPQPARLFLNGQEICTADDWQRVCAELPKIAELTAERDQWKARAEAAEQKLEYVLTVLEQYSDFNSIEDLRETLRETLNDASVEWGDCGECADKDGKLKAAEQKNAELAQILECDRTTLADVLKEIKAIRDGYFWITEGRGNYEWNDDRYRQEFGDAIRALNTALKPLEKLAADFTGCPATTAEVVEARSPLKKIAELEHRCAELAAALDEARQELFAYGDKNEITDHPWWAIVRNGSFGRMVVLVGPFFSRDAAEEHRLARIHEYKEKSYVFCFSGHYSKQYKALREALKQDPSAILAARDEAHHKFGYIEAAAEIGAAIQDGSEKDHAGKAWVEKLEARLETARREGALAMGRYAAEFCEKRALYIDGNLSADLNDITKWIAAVESGEIKPWGEKK